MAKDILVDTNKGDFLTSEWDKRIRYFDVVWGNLFSGDDKLYMNIIVPQDDISTLKYDDNNEFVCNVHADYCPEASSFYVRLVTRGDNNNYINLQQVINGAPTESVAVYYHELVSSQQELMASQLAMIGTSGYYKVQFVRLGGGSISRAVFYQSENVDFVIGDADNQSAQLLARCAPGKYYRYPTTGVDLTKYIGSVVEHSDLTESLQTEFERDQKNIVEADFNNENGDLSVLFSEANEAEDKDLADVNTLDVELFKVADDDYIRLLYKASMGILANNEKFRNNIMNWVGNLIGLWDVNGDCELEDFPYNVNMEKKKITPIGLVDDANTGYNVAVHYNVPVGTLYALDYPTDGSIYTSEYEVYQDDLGNMVKSSYWKRDGLFMVEDSDKNIFVDDAVEYKERTLFDSISQSKCRRLFMPLKTCNIYYYNGFKEKLDKYGLKKVVDKKGNYSSILAIIVHPTTGKMYGLVTLDSLIEELKVDLNTGRLLIIKQKK